MDSIRILENIISGVAVGLVVGLSGLIVWRLQKIYSRRFEIAEEARVLFSQLETMLWHAREDSPERDNLVVIPQEYGDVEQYFLPLKRISFDLLKFKELYFEKVPRMQALCDVHLAEEAYYAFFSLTVAEGMLYERQVIAMSALSEGVKSRQFSPEQVEVAERALAFLICERPFKEEASTDIVSMQISMAREMLDGACSNYHNPGIFRLLLGIP